MGTLEQHIDGFIELGDYLCEINKEDARYAPLFDCLQKAEYTNGWFTQKNSLQALEAWGNALKEEKIKKWLRPYELPNHPPKNIGLILAGNIPLVGFHDVLSVLISGHNAAIKLSSSDPYLIPFLYQQLQTISAVFKNRLHFTKERLEDFDAVIATGSNNAARYFDYYFAKVPNLIRKNRNGIAVLSGNESKEELAGLAQDIVQYFGLGCRNISKVYLPKGYDLNLIFSALYPHADLMESAKYANNYDYNKAVFLMSEIDLLDNGFILLRESEAFGSPVACLHYQYYNTVEELSHELENKSENIQCICSSLSLKNARPLGKAQQPELWDYADGVDSIAFLSKLSANC